MVRKATEKDAPTLAEMAAQLWEGHDIAALEEEFAEALTDSRTAFFICYPAGEAVGFAQCALRTDYVEGTESSPVGYLEGIFVKPAHRKKGYARQLVGACELWAKALGCSEFASDCELGNIGSLKFHLAMGFAEANRIICFKKSL